MDMFISNFYRKYFLGLYIYCYMYFQISFLISCFPFLSHPLTSIGNLYTCTIYRNDDIFIFKILIFIISIIYLDVQPVYPSVYCGIIWDGRYFSFRVALCNTFSLSIRKMKIRFSISKEKKKGIRIMKWLSNLVFVHLF